MKRSRNDVDKEDVIFNRYIENERKKQKSIRLAHACRPRASTPDYEFGIFYRQHFIPEFRKKHADSPTDDELSPHIWDWRCRGPTDEEWNVLLAQTQRPLHFHRKKKKPNPPDAKSEECRSLVNPEKQDSTNSLQQSNLSRQGVLKSPGSKREESMKSQFNPKTNEAPPRNATQNGVHPHRRPHLPRFNRTNVPSNMRGPMTSQKSNERKGPRSPVRAPFSKNNEDFYARKRPTHAPHNAPHPYQMRRPGAPNHPPLPGPNQPPLVGPYQPAPRSQPKQRFPSGPVPPNGLLLPNAMPPPLWNGPGGFLMPMFPHPPHMPPGFFPPPMHNGPPPFFMRNGFPGPRNGFSPAQQHGPQFRENDKRRRGRGK